MKNNHGFTLIELLAVIVVLAIVMVLATTTILPYMSDARERAFRIEATDLVSAAKKAKELYDLGEVKINTSSENSCLNTEKICFTVAELIDLGIYDGAKDKYKGKVEITSYKDKQPTYTLYLTKGTEFYINGGTAIDYTDTNVKLTSNEPSTGYDICTCN